MDFLRGFLSIIGGFVVGVGVCFGVNAWVYGSPPHGYGSMQSLQGTWGVIAGVMTGISLAAFIAKARLSVSAQRNLWTGFGILAVVAALFTATFGAGWGWPSLTSLEGAWFYPVEATLIAFATFAFSRRRARAVRTKNVDALKW